MVAAAFDKKHLLKNLVLAAVFLIAFIPKGLAFDPGLPPIEDSLAYQQFSLRPISDQSILIYLIDRFAEADISIKYGTIHFPAPFAARVARWFLRAHYKGQKPKEWILQWCDTTVPTGDVIWVRDGQGEYKRSRDILFEELEALRELHKRKTGVVLME